MPKSVCAVEMTMCVHWTYININRKDSHTSMVSINGIVNKLETLPHGSICDNISDEFDIGHCLNKVKVTVSLQNFSQFTKIQSLKFYISSLAVERKL